MSPSFLCPRHLIHSTQQMTSKFQSSATTMISLATSNHSTVSWWHSCFSPGSMRSNSLNTPLHSTLQSPNNQSLCSSTTIYCTNLSQSPLTPQAVVNPLHYAEIPPQLLHCVCPPLSPFLLCLVLPEMCSGHHWQSSSLFQSSDPFHPYAPAITHQLNPPLLKHLLHNPQQITHPYPFSTSLDSSNTKMPSPGHQFFSTIPSLSIICVIQHTAFFPLFSQMAIALIICLP